MWTHGVWQRARIILVPAILLMLAGTGAGFSAPGDGPDCSGLPGATAIRTLLQNAVTHGGDAGGIFHGSRMWGAVVNRSGQICSYATSTTDPTQVWPGSRAIAQAKAYTANAFSLDSKALSTALLYTFSQPGHSLYGLNQSNPFNPEELELHGSRGEIAGGIITFGGGVPLYNSHGHIIGGLGVSGDTACADHEIAKRVRDLAGLNPPGGALVDDIQYSAVDGASPFTHPQCLNTFRNGVPLGTEQNATGY